MIDSAVLMGLAKLGIDVYSGRFVSFFTAATVTWYLNRIFTFKDRDRAILKQWSKFVSVNALGGAINYGVYAACVSLFSLVAAYPVIGVAAGSIPGLIFNYSLSRRIVFVNPRGRAT